MTAGPMTGGVMLLLFVGWWLASLYLARRSRRDASALVLGGFLLFGMGFALVFSPP